MPALFLKNVWIIYEIQGASKTNEVLMPYLVSQYDDKYKPVFEIIIKTRKGSTYGKFISDLYKRIESKEVES